MEKSNCRKIDKNIWSQFSFIYIKVLKYEKKSNYVRLFVILYKYFYARKNAKHWAKGLY